jgi:GT2 family glycosyltransferase
MKLQIVIPLLNLWSRYTLPCLASIRTSIEHRVVVVDNASTDETQQEACKRVNERFVYHRNPTNLGVARVWNDGCRDAFDNGYDFALVLNNDILLHPECIDRLVSRIAGDECAGIVTPANHREICSDPQEVFRIDPQTRVRLPDSETPDFAAFLLSRACWQRVGPFDENFAPAYFEDNDYHYRMGLDGMRAIAHPPAVFYHFGSRTQNEAASQPIVHSSAFERNREYYIGKWGGPPGAEVFRRPFGPDYALRNST